MIQTKFRIAICPLMYKALQKNLIYLTKTQVHTEQRSFVCFCGKSYKRRSHLNRHFATTEHDAVGLTNRRDGFTPLQLPADPVHHTAPTNIKTTQESLYRSDYLTFARVCILYRGS